MSKLRLEGKTALKRKRLCNKAILKAIVSNKGMTLIEVMIAGGISVVVSLGIAGIYIFAIQQFTILVNMNTAQENALWMSYHTKNLLSQAVNVHPYSASSPCWPDVTSLVGCIRNRTTTNSGGANPSDRAVTSTSGESLGLVAFFQREWGEGEGSGSLILPTAIFFREPSATRDGRLYFDINTQPGHLVRAGEDDIVYGQVVQYDLTLTNENIYGTPQATGVEVTLKTRYQRTTSSENWCVEGQACSGAPAAAAYSDVEMKFNVGLRNNRALEKVGDQPRSIHGGIYYYRFIPPLFRNN